MQITHEDADNLFVGMFRYALGRKTYFVSDAAQTIANNWNQIPTQTQDLIRKELDKAIAEDASQRVDGKRYPRLGMDCDRETWVTLRETILIKDKERGQQ